MFFLYLLWCILSSIWCRTKCSICSLKSTILSIQFWSIQLNKLENWPTQIGPNDKTIAAIASGQLCTACRHCMQRLFQQICSILSALYYVSRVKLLLQLRTKYNACFYISPRGCNPKQIEKYLNVTDSIACSVKLLGKLLENTSKHCIDGAIVLT